MKKLLYILGVVSLSHLAIGQTPNTNNVKTTTYQVKTQNGTTNATTSQNLTDDEKIEGITYFDGLGRPVQSIAKQAGGNRETIITPVVYDALGRQPKDYLPYAYSTGSSTALNYITQLDVFEDLESYYVNKYPSDQITTSTINAYSEKVFENSPLNRVLEQGAPGKDWLANPLSETDHTIKFEYQANSASEVKLFRVIFPTGNTELPDLIYGGHYAANELYKNITKDENWISGKGNTVEEFKDKQGRVVLKRTYNNGKPHDTQYIYDDFGNLTYVLSPKGSDALLTENMLQNFSQTIAASAYKPKGTPTSVIATGQTNISLVGNQLTIDFNMSYSSPISLAFRSIANSQLTYAVPNMMIGTIQATGGQYIVSVQDGYLTLSGTGQVTNVTQSFTVTVPEYGISQVELDKLCYQYHYDKRNRLVEKKIPQKGWEYIVYNKLDQPIMTQDANLKAQNKWLFTKYDAFGRVAYTGLATNTNLRTSVQNSANGVSSQFVTKSVTSSTIAGTPVYYNNGAYPTSNIFELHTINYYDNYIFDKGAGTSETAFGITPTTNTKGLATGSKVRILGTSDWITSLSYYDDKARPIYSYSHNVYLQTTDKVKSELDFVGKVIQTESSHVKGTNTAIVVKDVFSYDHMGRLLTQKQQIGSGAQELIVKSTYDELGQLVLKGVGGTETSPLQQVDYGYNIRGWLKRINDPGNLGDDLFGFTVNYNTNDIGSTKLYNGNITETIWKTANDVLVGGKTRGYSYSYDELNRIGSATYATKTTGNFAQTDKYGVDKVRYDKNGNIISLIRTGQIETFDELAYYYDGNQLTEVKDAVINQHTEGFIDGLTGIDYTYDANGNMLKDLNKGISSNIVYNHLNLPTQVTIGSGNIQYIYDATGQKLKKTVSTGTNIEYAGHFIYENGTLKFFSHPEGYVEPDGSGGYDYVYQYKDHLGNIRLSYMDSSGNGKIEASTEIIEENNYYPFGLKHKGYNNVVNGTQNNYQTYNGKEWNESLGLNFYEMDLRQFDPAIARWTTIDPVTHHSQSTYTGYDNNPVFWTDPSGASVTTDENGTYYTGEDAKVAFLNLRNSASSSNDSSEDDTESDSDVGFKPLTKEVLRDYVSKNLCQGCSKGQLERTAGLFFEAQFAAFAKGVTPAKFRFRMGNKLYGPRNTVPDFVSDIFRKYKGIRGYFGSETRIPGGAAYEVKAIDGSLYLSSSTNQIRGHIDNMASKFSLMEATYGSQPALTLATTYNVSISGSVLDHAAAKGVRVNQVVSYYKEVNNTMIIVFGPKMAITEFNNQFKN